MESFFIRNAQNAFSYREKETNYNIRNHISPTINYLISRQDILETLFG